MNSAVVFSLIQTMTVAAAIGLGLAFLVWYLYRSVYIGLVLVLLLFLAEAAALGLPVFSVGLSAYPSDIVFVLIGVAAVFRAASLSYYSKAIKIWLFVGAVLTVSFVPGVLKFGTTAGVEFREYYYFWVGALYFMTFPISERQLAHIVRLWAAAASVVVLIAIYRWSVHFAGGDTSAWADLAATNSLRVINASQTLFIAQALIVVICLRLSSAATSSVVTLPFLAIAVLVMQHRTVWVVTVVCLVAIAYLERKTRGRLVGNVAVMVVIALAILIPVLVAGNHLNVVTESLQASVVEAQSEHSTLVWRVEGWEELLRTWAASGPWQYLFGNPFGSGAARYIPGVAEAIRVSPHNYYVSMLLHLGLAGITAILAVYARALKALFSVENRPGEFPRRGLLVLLLGQLVFFIAYSPDYTQSILLGVVLALITRDELAAKQRRAPLSAYRAYGTSAP